MKATNKQGQGFTLNPGPMPSNSSHVSLSLTKGWRMTTASYQVLSMTAFLAQPDLESQVEYLRFRFSNIRFKAFFLGFALLYQSLVFSFYHFFFTLKFGFLIVWFFYLTNKTQTNPRLNLINVLTLNYLLRSQIFVNDDGQLRVAHLILDYEPIRSEEHTSELQSPA